ncbi:hypothetical protein D3C76_1051400 [compost metagenome]
MRYSEAFIVSQDSDNHHFGKFVDIEDRIKLIVTISTFHFSSVHPAWNKLQIQVFIDQTKATLNDAFPVWPKRWQNLHSGTQSVCHRLTCLAEKLGAIGN